jgi:hypothetical protein
MNSLTNYFEFLESNDKILHERYEVASTAFGEFRRKIFYIILRMNQSDDTEEGEISNSIRALLFNWLTTPVAFDSSFRDALSSFGDPSAFERRWGLSGEFKSAIHFADELINEESLMRIGLAETIRATLREGKKLKIFCHRKARGHFDSLASSNNGIHLNDSTFLHSVRDYSASDPFDVLIKVGPLRSKGWGAVPDAIRSAPKFKQLTQFVWSGCSDDPRFGYDPAETSDLLKTTNIGDKKLVWNSIVIKSGHDDGRANDNDSELDEFSLFVETNRQATLRHAVLLEISNCEGMIYPYTEIASFDPSCAHASPVDLRTPAESLMEGMFIIEKHVSEIVFSETQAKLTGYCQIWKKRLAEELQSNSSAFCHSLFNNGLKLQNLESCLKYWAQPPSSVVHAPQAQKHFKILIDTLGIGADNKDYKVNNSKPWWRYAWDEIRVSRGEASQAGRQESQIIEEASLEILKFLIEEIRQKANSSDRFRIVIPSGCQLQGFFDFFKVLRIEEGFFAPDLELKIIRNIVVFNKWKIS